MKSEKSKRKWLWFLGVLGVLLVAGTLAISQDYLGLRQPLIAAWDKLGITGEPSLPVQGSPAPAPVPVDETITLNAVGDVMLARKVGRLIEANGTDYPLRLLGAELAAGDITFANLESPIASSGRPLPGKGICFRAAPAALASLTLGGFDVVSLANNHAVDYDSPALLETLELLAQSGIKTVGAGADINEARQPAILEAKGVKLAFLAYSDLADVYFSSKYPRPHRADANQSGVAPLEERLILEDIQAAAQQADLVLVSLHWGTEYVDQPSKQQREMAHRLIEAGADVILGHHPHWLQGLEVYQGKLIAYSLGNMVFDQNWSEATREGLVLQLELDRQGVRQAQVRPVFIQESQPGWAAGARQAKLNQQVVDLCRKLNTAAQVEGEWVKLEMENKSAGG